MRRNFDLSRNYLLLKLSKSLLFCIGLFVSCTAITGQVGNDFIGARSAAMGGYSVTLADVWSTNNNQAGLGFVTNFSAGIYYENRFLLKETGYKAMAVALPINSGAFGIHVTSFGFDLYNETKIGLSYGQRFGDRFSLGVQINYLNTQLTQEYGNNISFTGAIGFLAKLSDELSIGAHVYNPTRSKLAEYDDERVLTIMKLGADYRFSEKVMVAISTEKAMNLNAIVNAGIEYNVSEMLYFRGGISSNPTQYAFGIGMQLNSFKVDLSSSFHQTLGITPGIAITYRRNQNNPKEIISEP